MKRVLNIRNAFETLATCFEYLQRVLKHLKRVLNISNAFEIFETCFEYSQRLWNSSTRAVATCFEYLQRVWNILNAFETFKTCFKYWQRLNPRRHAHITPVFKQSDWQVTYVIGWLLTDDDWPGGGIQRGGGGGSLLSTSHANLSDCKFDSVVYAGVCGADVGVASWFGPVSFGPAGFGCLATNSLSKEWMLYRTDR